MGEFPYEVRYFHAKKPNKQDGEEFFKHQITYFSQIGTIIGGIKGETGIEGLKLDFNNGLRLQVPAGNWHVRIGDTDSGLVYFDEDAAEVILISLEKYYVHWQVDVFLDGRLVFEHIFTPRQQRLFLIICSYAIGDTLAFLPYIPAARDFYEAQVSYYVADNMREVAARFLPDIPFTEQIPEDTYATFYFGAGIDAPMFMPLDGRMYPMLDMGRLILGMYERAGRMQWQPGRRMIPERYVCIGVQASSVAKSWIYPEGWKLVTGYLQELGYRVICIDKEKRMEQSGVVAEIPPNAEDFTGSMPLAERADMLYYADFFIGLPSGLSWLADATGCPVIMIGGFSYSWYEFPTPYRVYNPLACHGCMNDVHVNAFENPCPHKNSSAEDVLECSRTISPQMVVNAINRLLENEGLRAGFSE